MEEQQTRRVRIHVTGRVQGVGFRYSARSVGESLGLDVGARNLADGSVTIDAEGPTAAVEELIEWAAIGPPAARVDRITVDEISEGDRR